MNRAKEGDRVRATVSYFVYSFLLSSLVFFCSFFILLFFVRFFFFLLYSISIPLDFFNFVVAEVGPTTCSTHFVNAVMLLRFKNYHQNTFHSLVVVFFVRKKCIHVSYTCVSRCDIHVCIVLLLLFILFDFIRLELRWMWNETSFHSSFKFGVHCYLMLACEIDFWYEWPFRPGI